MIFYLVTREHPYTINDYVAFWGKSLGSNIRTLFYDQLSLRKTLGRGVYIFSDLERLNPAYMELAKNAWNALNDAGGCITLNNPSRILLREPMLRALHRAGKNPFAVHGVYDDPAAVRFPVFIRARNSHDGALTLLLHTRQQLSAELSALRGNIVPDEELLIVEYCDTADTHGIFRKYGAFCVAGQILPRHILLGGDWIVKYPDKVNPQTVAQEQQYLNENPHCAQLREIFSLANIDYGRIDYSLQNGSVVTWEINTNPTISVSPESLSPLRQPLQPLFMDPFARALEGLQKPVSDDSIPFQTPRELIQRLRQRKHDRALRIAKKGLRRAGGKVLRRLKLRA
jgi:hypothetical protein